MQSNIKIGRGTWKSYAPETECLFNPELGSDTWTLVPSDIKLIIGYGIELCPK